MTIPPWTMPQAPDFVREALSDLELVKLSQCWSDSAVYGAFPSPSSLDEIVKRMGHALNGKPIDVLLWAVERLR